jgi:photosystem II stability/assembly factor-like uncharacterized protein
MALCWPGLQPALCHFAERLSVSDGRSSTGLGDTENAEPLAAGEVQVSGRASSLITAFLGGPCRDRTDDIHGVNVALYQLS